MYLYTTGAMIFGLTVVVANLKVICFSYDFTIASLFVNFGSMLVYFGIFIGFSGVTYTDIYLSFEALMTAGNFHLGNIVAIIFCSGFEFAHETFMRFS